MNKSSQLKAVDIPVFPNITIETSGVCNAKCTWCQNGLRASKGLPEIHKRMPSRFMPPEQFAEIVSHLESEGLIERNKTQICIHNWGEPSLHPKLGEILDIIADRGFLYKISTNGSNRLELSPKQIRHANRIVFSFSGFSQDSQDRIHGFQFDKIVGNLDYLVEQFKKYGADTYNILLVFHVYQFNINEAQPAADYCIEKKIRFNPLIAYLNDYDLTNDYVKDALDIKILDKISREILLTYVKKPTEFSNIQDPDFDCISWDGDLVIDEYGKLLPCCGVPKNHPHYSLGNVLELNAREIILTKRYTKACIDCAESGFYDSVVTSSGNAMPIDFIRALQEKTRPRENKIKAMVRVILPTPVKTVLKKILYR